MGATQRYVIASGFLFLVCTSWFIGALVSHSVPALPTALPPQLHDADLPLDLQHIVSDAGRPSKASRTRKKKSSKKSRKKKKASKRKRKKASKTQHTQRARASSALTTDPPVPTQPRAAFNATHLDECAAARDSCVETQQEHGIRPGKTWGRASKAVKAEWAARGCDALVKTSATNTPLLAAKRGERVRRCAPAESVHLTLTQRSPREYAVLWTTHCASYGPDQSVALYTKNKDDDDIDDDDDEAELFDSEAGERRLVARWNGRRRLVSVSPAQCEPVRSCLTQWACTAFVQLPTDGGGGDDEDNDDDDNEDGGGVGALRLQYRIMNNQAAVDSNDVVTDGNNDNDKDNDADDNGEKDNNRNSSGGGGGGARASSWASSRFYQLRARPHYPLRVAAFGDIECSSYASNYTQRRLTRRSGALDAIVMPGRFNHLFTVPSIIICLCFCYQILNF
jgi:hypothetical protein